MIGNYLKAPALSEENDIEIYKQRYETWRHLDKIRWQIIQFYIAILTGIVLLYQYDSTPKPAWIIPAIGIVIMSTSLALFKVNSGIRANGKVLHEIGNKVGDIGIPDVSNSSQSIGHWIAGGSFLVGLAITMYGVVQL